MIVETTSSFVRGVLGVQDPLEKVAFDKSPIAIVLLDRDGMIFGANKAAEELLGSAYPLQGENLYSFVDAAGVPDFIRGFVDHPKRHSPDDLTDCRFRIRDLQGAIRLIQAHLGNAMYNGTKLAVACLVRTESEPDGP